MIEQKITIDEFLEEFAPASRPHRVTVIRRIQRGDYQGRKEGGTWYIIKPLSTGDARADEILSKYRATA